MVEGTARDKLTRAINTRTLQSGEQQELQVGDQVEYWRKQGSKDVTCWLGPATVTDVSQLDRGVIKVKDKGQEMVCRSGDVRPILEFLIFQLVCEMAHNIFQLSKNNMFKRVGQYVYYF